MAKIAVIDDWINPRYIKSFERIEYIFLEEAGDCEKRYISESTHATLIAKMLETYATNYTVLNIVLALRMDEDQDIWKVKKALEICETQHVDIVCMSFGTVKVSDGRVICDIIKKLYADNIIMLAAADNQGFYMLPCAMKEVIGVGCDSKQELMPGKYIYNLDNFWNIDITVGDDLNIFTNRKRINPSTSCCVPIVAAYVNQCMNCGIHTQKDVREWLKKKAVIARKTTLKKSKERAACSLPIVASEDFGEKEWMQMIKIMNDNFDIEVMGISQKREINNYQFVLSMNHSLEEILTFVEGYTTADIIFLAGGIGRWKVVTDIQIEKEETGYICKVRETGKSILKTRMIDLCQVIVEVLS